MYGEVVHRSVKIIVSPLIIFFPFSVSLIVFWRRLFVFISSPIVFFYIFFLSINLL
jgi:hypothetical protein